MIDVNKITSTLAKLPDAQLQQYAQMHKADPYIMALAMSESNRRKELRSAGQGAQGVQEQPKVIDQEIAGMAPSPAPQLPEEQGIGQLPAGNMNFADGGIVAFAGGGDVERYQYGGVTPQYGGYIPGFVAGTGNIQPQQGAPEEVPLLRRWYREAADAAQQSRVQEARTRIARGQPAAGDTALVAAASGETGSVFTPAPTSGFGGAAPAAPADTAAASNISGQKGAPPAQPPAPRAPSAPAASGIGVPGLVGMDVSKMFAKEMAKASLEPHPQAKELEEIGGLKVKAKEDEATGLEAIQQKYADVAKGRKERLDTKEAEIAKMSGQSLGLSLLQAGAAMMSTPGGIGAALGRGADVGSKQYIAGIDRITAAKDKLSDARDRLEEFEAQRGEMSARELFKARNDIKNAQIGAKEDMVKAVMQRDNVNREIAMKTVDNQIKVASTVYEQQQANARTAATAGRNPQLELLQEVSRDPRLAAAYQAMHGKGEDVMGQYNDFVKANPMLAADPKQAFTQFLMTKSAFQQLGRPTITDKPASVMRPQ